MEKQFGGEVATAGVDERVQNPVAGERGGKAGDSSKVSQELEGFFDHAKMGLNGRDYWGKTFEAREKIEEVFGLRSFGLKP